jgi:hypothetical protein
VTTEELRTLLGNVAGHLVPTSSQPEHDLQRLDESLARSILPEQLEQLKGSRFVFENADLFLPEQISPERSAALQSIAQLKATGLAEPEFRAFVREVPVRSTQLHASVPFWAAGAAVDHTIGPFTNKDGRTFWFDFFRIQKLVALYIQGRPDPALLFNVQTRPIFTDVHLPPITDPLPTYHLPAGSIWINSQVLAPNAPASCFTGLTIKGGTITLSASPQIIDGKLTIAPTATVTVNLDLQQPIVQDADPSSPYGIDARNAALQLPQQLAFHFSGQGGNVDEISDAGWTVYGDQASFKWNKQAQPSYNSVLHCILVSLNCSNESFLVRDCQSPFFKIEGQAPITGSAWVLPAATIDVIHPTPAAGIGALLVICGNGLSAGWTGLEGANLTLTQPGVMAEPGHISVADLNAGKVISQQSFKLWKDEQNPFGTSIQLQYPSATPLFYNTVASGVELLMILANANVQIDRPVTVAGQALAIHSKNSVLVLGLSKVLKLVYLFDDNILFDSTDLYQKPPVIPQPIGVALHNALFKVTPVNGCLLVGALADDLVKVDPGFLFLTFGLLAYLPTLPDPYAANIGSLKYQFRGDLGQFASGTTIGRQTIWMWLVCEVQWKPGNAYNDQVNVSFHFAPLQTQFSLMQAGQAGTVAENTSAEATRGGDLCRTLLTPRNDLTKNQASAVMKDIPTAADINTMASIRGWPDYTGIWNEETECLGQDIFALLDVSTHADLLGVSFTFGREMLSLYRSYAVTPGSTAFPFQVEGMDIVSQGNSIRAFTVPQISWEPVINTAPQAIAGDPPGYAPGNPPTLTPNYYPDDGGPTRIYNNSIHLVPLAPLPLSKFLLKSFKQEPGNITSALFTLPFGMRALAVLTKFVNPQHPPVIRIQPHKFANDVRSGLALEFHAGMLPTDEYPMFNGATVQTANVLDLFGNPSGAGTLGASVGFIFDDEFKLKPDPLTSRGVPLTRVDFSGYGASIFSDWLNPNAQMAQTSQAQFDVWLGRSGHEVVQVKSIIYPWGIRVVRTIILYRAATGYEYRVDTGWQPQSDGRFDFSYYLPKPGDPTHRIAEEPGYKFHPGVIRGLFNVKNIVEQNNQFPTTTVIKNGQMYLDDNNNPVTQAGGDTTLPALLQMVTFDADVDIEGAVQGAVNGRVPSKGIMGFVQLAPRGIPLSVDALVKLLNYQPTPIGGPVDCIVNIGGNGQNLRVNRFDVSNSVDTNGVDPVFAVSARGSVILPKEGAWSMTQHSRGTGEVTPLPQQLAVPLIRSGVIQYQLSSDSGGDVYKLVTPDPTASLLRFANPLDLLRTPGADTVNYGFLFTTDTQKALFLTPAYKLLGAGDQPTLLSKTPPLFVDAFRIVDSKAIFPNVRDADTVFGDAINLYSQGTEFVQNTLTDGGKNVLNLMQINQVVAGVQQEGYKLLRQVTNFQLPNTDWTLIQVGSAFKIYIEYKADNVQKPDGSTQNVTGALDFDVNSFASATADRWKSLMSNVALVVDLGPITRLMTIKGDWNSQNGAEAQYGGGSDIPTPQIEFSPVLQPAIDILQILEELQGENYASAFAQGLKLAMSNQADSWQYKLEASKEIPVVKFPPPPLDNDPNAPLKLQAGLKLGAYFNAALMIPTDPTQLLPSAGGYLGFTGQLSVMCLSISIATVYAVGKVNLDIGADTKAGATLDMKFGFGAQIVVGLPIVGNVSVLYMVGVEIYTDATQLQVSGFLMFQGHAELLGGLVGITITIEAKGTVSRANDRTDLAAQVTFAIDISIFLVIDIDFSTSWQEQRQIA